MTGAILLSALLLATPDAPRFALTLLLVSPDHLALPCPGKVLVWSRARSATGLTRWGRVMMTIQLNEIDRVSRGE